VKLMRIPRSALLIATSATVSALALAGCAAAVGGAAKPDAAAEAAVPAAAPLAAATPNCKDGKSPVASLAPGNITTDPNSITKSPTLDRIKKNGYLTVGTSSDVLLWGATNPKNGNLEGFDIDVVGEVAKALGLKPNQIQYKVVNYGQRLTSLKKGDVDIVAHTMTINCARWQGANTASAPNAINFSSEYYLAGQRVLVRSDDTTTNRIQDLKGKPVCVPAGSTNVENVKGMGLKLVQLAVIGDCLVKFQEGEVVAITGDDTVLAGFAYQDPYAKVVGPRFSQEPYGLGINADDPQFTQFVNAVLEKLRADGTLKAIYAKTMGAALGGAAPPVPQPVYGRILSKLGRAS
jgi:polar amino acid transport system substrate-binding protein